MLWWGSGCRCPRPGRTARPGAKQQHEPPEVDTPCCCFHRVAGALVLHLTPCVMVSVCRLLDRRRQSWSLLCSARSCDPPYSAPCLRWRAGIGHVGRAASAARPRVRDADGSGELVVPAYELFTGTEILGRMAMERMLTGLSTRRYTLPTDADRQAAIDKLTVDE